jgi:hypothetical protein
MGGRKALYPRSPVNCPRRGRRRVAGSSLQGFASTSRAQSSWVTLLHRPTPHQPCSARERRSGRVCVRNMYNAPEQWKGSFYELCVAGAHVPEIRARLGVRERGGCVLEMSSTALVTLVFNIHTCVFMCCVLPGVSVCGLGNHLLHEKVEEA